MFIVSLNRCIFLIFCLLYVIPCCLCCYPQHETALARDGERERERPSSAHLPSLSLGLVGVGGGDK